MLDNSEYTEEDHQRHLSVFYGGNSQSYEYDIRESGRTRYNFNDLALAGQIHPEHEAEGKRIIKFLLGYLPPDSFTIKQEPFIRVIHESYITGKIDHDQMLLEAEEHVKLIREIDMLHDIQTTYGVDSYQSYFEYLPEMADRAKSRLVGFLGYEPWLEASVNAELLLREAMADDRFKFTGNLNSVDLQAITRVHFRETFLQKQLAAANASPLVALDYMATYPFDPEKETI